MLILSSVEGHEHREKYEVETSQAMPFEQSNNLGGIYFKSHCVDGSLFVGIGAYLTLHAIPCTYLHNLVLVWKGQIRTIPFLAQRICFPWSKNKRFGWNNTVETNNL